MKHQFLYRVLFAIVFSITVVFTLRVDAQCIPKNKSSLTWGIGFGYGSYKGLVLHEEGQISITAPGTASFTKVATAFRLLMSTNLLGSRLSIGVEYALQQVKKGAESPYFYTDAPDAMIHTVLILGDYLGLPENVYNILFKQ